jgi:hypothetical protein
MGRNYCIRRRVGESPLSGRLKIRPGGEVSPAAWTPAVRRPLSTARAEKRKQNILTGGPPCHAKPE